MLGVTVANGGGAAAETARLQPQTMTVSWDCVGLCGGQLALACRRTWQPVMSVLLNCQHETALRVLTS